MFALKNSSRQRRSFQPALENLEDRSVPATSIIGPMMDSLPTMLPAVQDTYSFPAVQNTYSYLPAVQNTCSYFPAVQSVDLLKAVPSDPKLQPTPAAISAMYSMDWLNTVTQAQAPAVNGILLPALSPELEGQITMLPAVQDPAMVGPQPEPPTKPVANIATDSSHAGILIGMLDQNEIDPQPTPPAPIELSAIDESISNLLPVFTPNELNGILLPALSQELAATQGQWPWAN